MVLTESPESPVPLCQLHTLYLKHSELGCGLACTRPWVQPLATTTERYSYVLPSALGILTRDRGEERGEGASQLILDSSTDPEEEARPLYRALV